jgi:hypothetical protein
VSVASAGPTVIDFSSFATGTALTSLDGITFSLQGGPDSSGPPLIGYGGAPPEGLSNSTNPDYPTAGILNFAFSAPVSGVSFYFNDYGNYGYGSYYQAFSSSDTLLESGSLMGEDGSENNILSASGIADIQFNNNAGGNDWYFAVPSITFNASSTAVPEPISLSLFGAGLAGMAALRRRKKAAKA